MEVGRNFEDLSWRFLAETRKERKERKNRGAGRTRARSVTHYRGNVEAQRRSY